MKNYLFAVASLGAIAIASPAFADGTNTGTDSTVIQINANTPAKCDLTAASNSVSLGAYDLTNDEGRARNNVGQKVAQALNGANVRGWCTGASNSFILSRSSLNTGDGQQSAGFNQAVIYDIQASIENATRNSGGDVAEGTSDGPTLGPVISRFGPTGSGEKVSFISEPSAADSSAVSSGSTLEKARGDYGSENNARLVAGDYTGTVTIAVTPGV